MQKVLPGGAERNREKIRGMTGVQYSMKQIAKITGGRLTGDPQCAVRHLATDSRSLPGVDNVLFIAIQGDHHDGNEYIEGVYARGVRCFLTDRVHPGATGMKGASFCIVEDSMKALHRLASERRTSFPGTLVAVTGSNGKTIVKEWIYQLLQHETSVIRSPRSYNSQLGVPLSLWQLSDAYKVAIIEAGISLPGEMDKLERIIAPDIGILTNIGPAHSENFSSDSHKLREKLLLFRRCKKLIYRSDLHVDGQPVENHLNDHPAERVSWSLGGKARYSFLLSAKDDGGRGVTMEHDGLSELGIPYQRTGELLTGLEPVEMRLEALKGIHGRTLVNDVYNSDLAGLRVALDVLMQQGRHPEKMVILSDVFQSGMKDEVLYAEVAALLDFKGVGKIIGIGAGISGQKALFPSGATFYPDTESFLQAFDTQEIENFAVLIKGARKFHFEQITQKLQLQVHKTVLEINIDEMIRNLNYFRSLLKPSTKIMVMVKALSYGAGGHEIAAFLQHEQIDYLAVAFPDEGIRLRRSGVQLPVMVMNADTADYRKLIEHDLEPEIYSREGLVRFISECRYLGLSDQPVHIKLDTGMHRLGFEEGDMDWLAEQLAAGEVKVKSLFTHLAGSNDPGLDSFTREQVTAFREMAAKIKKGSGMEPVMHVLNSSGTERFPEFQMDMVRIGIGLYGQGVKKELEPVSTFKTVISQIREVEPGESVGYGRGGKVTQRSRIATIPVGYADGINRHLGNGHYSFYLNGSYVPTIGNICMDMTMLDITGTEAAIGDEGELFGRRCPVTRMAGQLNTIVYEILTSIPERVKRVYIRE